MPDCCNVSVNSFVFVYCTANNDFREHLLGFDDSIHSYTESLVMESTIQKLHSVIQTFSRNEYLLYFATKRICKELFSKSLMYHKYRLCYLIYHETTFVLRQL